jgi:surfactin synthase thioesterase subunit
VSGRQQTAWSVVAIFGISVGGFVALAVAGEATVDYVALVGPILAAAFLAPKLGQIEHNTNGALTQRIKDAVQEALDERNAR